MSHQNIFFGNYSDKILCRRLKMLNKWKIIIVTLSRKTLKYVWEIYPDNLKQEDSLEIKPHKFLIYSQSHFYNYMHKLSRYFYSGSNKLNCVFFIYYYMIYFLLFTFYF